MIMDLGTPSDAQCRMLLALGRELEGVIFDVEQGNGFDEVCLRTVKRVRTALGRSGPFALTQSSTSAPKWSSTPPTKDGWYWLKEGHEAGMARVEGDCFWQYGEIFDVADVDGGLWCGPLQEPTYD